MGAGSLKNMYDCYVTVKQKREEMELGRVLK